MSGVLNKKTLAWTMYDWANSAFATSVMAMFFPVFFRKYWNGAEVASEAITFRLGVASAVASIVVVILAPLLGSVADRLGQRKRFLAVFAGLGIVMTGSLFFVSQGAWMYAAVLYVLASIGFMTGNSFYDALIVGVAPEGKLDLVSGMGYGFGYLGGGLLLAVHATLTEHPEWVGLTSAADVVRWAIVSVAVWWALFSVPLFLFVDEPPVDDDKQTGSAFVAGARELFETLKEIRTLKNTALFLVAYWFYIDGVDTVIRMAVDYGSAIEGIETGDLVKALLVTQFIGLPAAVAFGYLGGKLGPKAGIWIGIAAYCGICGYGYFVDSATDFYVVAISVGLVQGGIQALSRSLYARLIPQSKAGQFFGFYNMLGKFAAVLGPLLMGVVALFVNQRWSIVSIIVLFVIGGLVFRKVDVDAGAADAERFDAKD